MNPAKLIWIVIGFLILAAAAAGAYWLVQKTILQPDGQIPGLTQQITNPASVFCGTLGGRVELHRSVIGGETGICVLPDGRQCEEWALYQRNECVAR